ncbi:uncharacterized protein LOC102485629 [Tupaia chinensis]|uniref:uncharacterized protein LOC102485629 n=1 Tax=Tupaia chinensis TaxID=246437 RepID=UPI000703CCA0|nr:uncharacterized protein LOC102485629 [Tupaia chinensis]
MIEFAALERRCPERPCLMEPPSKLKVHLVLGRKRRHGNMRLSKQAAPLRTETTATMTSSLVSQLTRAPPACWSQPQAGGGLKSQIRRGRRGGLARLTAMGRALDKLSARHCSLFPAGYVTPCHPQTPRQLPTGLLLQPCFWGSPRAGSTIPRLATLSDREPCSSCPSSLPTWVSGRLSPPSARPLLWRVSLFTLAPLPPPSSLLKAQLVHSCMLCS